MATMRASIKAALEGDALLAAIATGGIYDTDDLGREGLSPSVPGLVDQYGFIKPAILLIWAAGNQYGPIHDGERQSILVYGYDDEGGSVIRTMQDHIKRILHRKHGVADDVTFWFTFLAGRGGEMRSMDVMSGAPSDTIRFIVQYKTR